MEDAILWSPGRTTGCFNSEDKVECRMRPPTRIKPSESTNASSLCNLLRRDTLFWLLSWCNSFPKAVFWTWRNTMTLALSISSRRSSPSAAWPLQLLRNLKTHAHIFKVQNQFLQTWTSRTSSSSGREQELRHLTSISSPSTSGLHSGICKSTSWRNAGPFSHRSVKTPREPSSAGFSAPLMWNHSSGLESSWILWTLLATKTLNLDASFLIYPRTTVLSVQKKWGHSKGNSSFNLEAICTHNTAATSSSRGTLRTGFKGTTLHFPIRNDTWHERCSSTHLK